jgi:hypothetical protein
MLRVHWLKHLGRSPVTWEMLIYNQYIRICWKYRFGPGLPDSDIEESGWLPTVGSDGFTEIPGWREETSLIYFHPRGYTWGIRSVQVFGSAMPNPNLGQNKVHHAYNRYDIQLAPYIQRGGGYSFLSDHPGLFNTNCLFRGNKAYIRDCGLQTGLYCNAKPWTGYYFPAAIDFEVPGLEMMHEWWVEIFSLYHTNNYGRYCASFFFFNIFFLLCTF